MLGEVLTAIVTPFREDGSVDFHRFAELAHYLIENGSDGVVVAGTTGESPTLSEDERLELFRVAVGALGEHATVIAGTGTYSTAESIHLTEQAHAIGVDGFLVVTPYYSKPPPRGIVAHFEAVASVSDRPVIVYNIPGRVVINIESPTMARRAEIENVTAVKQANDDLVQARFIAEETGLDLYAGDDNILFPFLEVGGVGGVCVHTHVVGPREGDDPPLQRRRPRRGAAAGRGADPQLRPAQGGAEPDRDQGGPQPPRTRGRRAQAAARSGHRRRGGGRQELPRAPRPDFRSHCVDSSREPGNVRIIPLGGLGEIGKNMTVLETGDGALVIDAGLAFPRDEHLGVDLVLPDFSYLAERPGGSRASSYACARGPCGRASVPPPRGRRAAHLRHEAHARPGRVEARGAQAHRPHRARRGHARGWRDRRGPFRLELVRMAHSIPDNAGVVVEANGLRILHTSDYKLDHTPIDGFKTDVGRLAELGNEGIDLMLGDSTNAERPGYTDQSGSSARPSARSSPS